MVEYSKPWLPVQAQIAKLASRGVEVGAAADAEALLRAVGYYRLTGYLYPFRRSERYVDDMGKWRVRVLSEYRPGTSLQHATQIIDFDRALRMLVLDGVERIEVSFRMQIGYVLGEVSPFAHLAESTFVSAFTKPRASLQSKARRCTKQATRRRRAATRSPSRRRHCQGDIWPLQHARCHGLSPPRGRSPVRMAATSRATHADLPGNPDIHDRDPGHA